MKKKLFAATFAVFLSFSASAGITIPKLITDSMVVQQHSIMAIPVKSRPGADVSGTASWDGRTVSAKCGEDGCARLEFRTPKAGGPYSISISDGDSFLTLKDILVGEVWICVGQSNMEMPVKGWGMINNWEQELAEADHPSIRLLKIRKAFSFETRDDTEVELGGWRPCSGETVQDFSAAAYFFARRITQELGIPVGVVDCSWGGTRCEAWTSPDILKDVKGYEFMADFQKDGKWDGAAYQKELQRRFDSICRIGSSMDPAAWHDDWGDVRMPQPFSRIGLETFDGEAWFQYRFNLPSECAGKPAVLALGIVDTVDETYLNGRRVGYTYSYLNPRFYEIEDGIVAGENILSVKVTDNSGEGGFLNGREDVYIEVDGKRYPLEGDWKFAIDLDFRVNNLDISNKLNNQPSVLYNAMYNPTNMLSARGFLWYQGCANTGNAPEYSELFPKMIEGWRAVRGRPDMPFYFVQLASYKAPVDIQPESNWAALREAQAAALRLPATEMVIATDIGDASDIHPKNKQEVGRRLALHALNDIYGRKCIHNAPALRSITFRGGKVELRFSGDITLGNDKGFVIRNASGEYRSVAPSLKNTRTIVLDATGFGQVDQVLYNYADYGQGLLRCARSGLPVAPFRKDI